MLQINPEFKKLIPALTVDEFQQLEANCLAEGIRDAIVVWNGYILDGHNRYEIANKHGLQYRTVEKHFESIYDAKDWMFVNQLGRRNLNEIQKTVLIGQRYNNQKQKHGGTGANQHTKEQSGHFGHSAKTAEAMAKEYNVGENTIKRDADFATGLEHVTPELEQDILQGNVKVNKGDVQELAKAEPFFVATTEAELKEKAKELKKAKEEKRKEKRAIVQNELQKMELQTGDKKYRIIYADPPWKYGNAMPEYVTEPQDYYLLMSTADICNMPVKDICQKDAVLFLWSTSPHLPEALEVVKAWGFEYKTSFVWDKIKHNMGHYNSVRHEFLLVCTRGSCTPDNRVLFDSVVSIERGEHSVKPDYFREIIEKLYIYGNKIELFAREAAAGWDVFGNQIQSNV